jgi:hypothetical protein
VVSGQFVATRFASFAVFFASLRETFFYAKILAEKQRDLLEITVESSVLGKNYPKRSEASLSKPSQNSF